MALSDYANSSSATLSKNHRANLYEKDPTLLIGLVSPIFILRRKADLKEIQLASPGSRQGLLYTAVSRQGLTAPNQGHIWQCLEIHWLLQLEGGGATSHLEGTLPFCNAPESTPSKEFSRPQSQSCPGWETLLFKSNRPGFKLQLSLPLCTFLLCAISANQ